MSDEGNICAHKHLRLGQEELERATQDAVGCIFEELKI